MTEISKSRKMIISHNKPTLGAEEAHSAGKVIGSGWIAQGQGVAEFEDAMCRYIGLPAGHGVALSSGTASLYLALKVLGIGQGDEVIVPTYVCSAILNAVYASGAKPVITDISKDDFNITCDLIKKATNSRTGAVVVPHIFGVPSDISRIKKIGIPVIEDCATALGSKIDKDHVGISGDIAIFSFYASKVITTGQGGMLVSKYTKYAESARDYRQFDYRKRYYPRFNFQMTDLQAVIGSEQLKKLPVFLRKRRAISRRYEDLSNAKGWDYQRAGCKGMIHNNYRFVLKLEEGTVRRLKDYLKTKGVETIVPIEHWELLHNYMKLEPARYNIAEDISRRTLSLPAYPRLFDEGLLDKIIKLLERF